jgi:hypothetical protein
VGGRAHDWSVSPPIHRHREPPREDADRSRAGQALAAPATQTISINFTYVSFSSILGGQISGNASVSGGVSDAGLSGLRGDVNLPLRDTRLSIEPTGTLVLQGEQLNVQWNV